MTRAFRRHGYDAVLLAEHDHGFDAGRLAAYRAACADASSPELLLVPGIEYSDPANAVHIPVWGRLPFIGAGLETSDLLREVSRLDGLAVLAHPGRRGVLAALDPTWLARLFGVEVWNRKYDGYAPNRAAAQLVRSHPTLTPFVSLDFHTARQFHPLAMLVEVEGELTEAALTESLRRRRVRATAYRLPALTLTRGPAHRAMCGAERTRKTLAASLRRTRSSADTRRRAG